MSLPEFAKWAQMIITGFAGLVMLMFWFHVRHLDRKGRDQGILYLGLGLMIWALLYGLELTFPARNLVEEGTGPAMFDRFLRRILSVMNSGLFLLTLPFFDHGFRRLHERLRGFHNPAKWRGLILTAASITLVLTFVSYWLFNDPQDEWIAGLPDSLFSLVAIAALAYAMFVSFWERGLPSLSALTALVLLALLSVQVLNSVQQAGIGNGQSWQEVFLLLRMTSHSLLAMLFFALAFTWIAERLQDAEQTVVAEPVGEVEKASQAGRRIAFGKNRVGKYYIDLTWGEKGLIEKRVLLSEGKFKYLLLAGVRRLEGQYVHGEEDIRYLYGGNIDTSNSAIKDALNKVMSKEQRIQDRGELMESRGQGTRQYRLGFSIHEIEICQAELAGDLAIQPILAELSPSEGL